jgi:hypothetical protein
LRHLPAFGVAGVALVALGWLWWRLCMFEQNGLEAMLARLHSGSNVGMFCSFPAKYYSHPS